VSQSAERAGIGWRAARKKQHLFFALLLIYELQLLGYIDPSICNVS